MARWMHTFQTRKEHGEEKLGTRETITAKIGRHVTVVGDLLVMDQRNTCAELSYEVGTAPSTIHAILIKRKMKCRKWVHNGSHTI
jgi:hypothetical protein